MDKPAVLVLEDGTVIHGRAIGKVGTTTGELCFTTAMTGYQESFTDPSYHRQILIMTASHIGNYGVVPEEAEAHKVHIAGLVVHRFSDMASRWLAHRSLQEYLEENGVVGISDVDTRQLVRHIRSKGAMNAIISSEELDVNKLKKLVREIPSMAGLELASEVSTPEPYYYGNPESPLRIAVMDYGVKRSSLYELSVRGAYLKVFPAKTDPTEVLKWNPDGIFLSNGPGDPAAMDYAIEQATHFMDKGIPLFGICLGHQILSLARGYKTFKMHHGHRGINHPVYNTIMNRSEITTQNHGFCVEATDKGPGIVSHINLNDNTNEGLLYLDKPAIGVQYHPEACPGPHDSKYLFDTFISLARGEEPALFRNVVRKQKSMFYV